MNSARKSSSSRGSQQEATTISIDYNHLSRLCLKHWMWLVGGLVLGLTAGYFYAASQTPIYQATASIVVNDREGGPPGDVGQADGIGDNMIKTYVEFLGSPSLAQRVVKSLKLTEDTDFLPPGVFAVSEDSATGILSSEMSIHNRLGTRVFDISVENRSPKMAQILATALAKESVNQYIDQHQSSGTVLSDFMQKEIDRLRDQLTKAEIALKAYENSHGIVASTALGPVDQTDSQLADLSKQYTDAQEQVTLLEGRYGPEHPKLIAAKELEAELLDQLNKLKAQATNTSSDNAEYSSLQTSVESYQSQLTSMLKQLNNNQASTTIDIPAISVFEEATYPYGTLRPNKPKIIFAGGFAGFMCGMGFIMALYFMDSSMRTVAQAEGALGIPVIAAVPILTETEGKTILPTFSDPHSFVAESFRGLRASLILHDRQHPLKTVLVVSAIPGEGKSFCAANLAVAFSQAGLKTLLIDADLRLPTAHTYFNVPASSISSGFIDVLTGRATLAAAAVASQVPNLSLLLTTVAADSPAELLSGARLPELLVEAAKTYDRVVIDSAPLNAVSDTMLIMQMADAILLVVRAAQTPASESKAALQKISSSNLKPLGLILNYLAAHTLKSYAYGYSYGQKPPKDKNAK